MGQDTLKRSHNMDYTRTDPAVELDGEILLVLYEHQSCLMHVMDFVERYLGVELCALYCIPSATPGVVARHDRFTADRRPTTRSYSFQPSDIPSTLAFQQQASGRGSGQSPCLAKTRPWFVATARRPAPAPALTSRHGRLGRGESALALGTEGV